MTLVIVFVFAIILAALVVALRKGAAPQKEPPLHPTTLVSRAATPTLDQLICPG